MHVHVRAILKSMNPSVTILDIRPSNYVNVFFFSFLSPIAVSNVVTVNVSRYGLSPSR
jgi:hypothetical protein